MCTRTLAYLYIWGHVHIKYVSASEIAAKSFKVQKSDAFASLTCKHIKEIFIFDSRELKY